MVSRPITDRKILDLENAESTTAWIRSFLAKCRAEKKEEKMNIDGAVLDLQVTKLFIRMCGKDAIIKLRSLTSLRNSIGTPYKNIRLATQNYFFLKERVVTAERAKFFSVIHQGVGESEEKFLARLREEASYCDFEKYKTAAILEEELV